MVSEYVEFWNEDLEEMENKIYAMSEGLYDEEKYWISSDHLLVGKLGEEAVKNCLGNLITEVDYKIYKKKQGDGGIDFRAASNLNIGIQVKTKSETGEKWYFGTSDLTSSQIFIFAEVRTYINSEYADIEILGFLTSDIVLDLTLKEVEEGRIEKIKLLSHQAFLTKEKIRQGLNEFSGLKDTSFFIGFDAKSIKGKVATRLRRFVALFRKAPRHKGCIVW